MDPNDLRDVKFYNTIAEITSSTLNDWNISLRKLTSENAFRVNFNSLKGIVDRDYIEGFLVSPYTKEIILYQEDHEWPAYLLQVAYKSITDIDFYIKRVF